MTGRPASVLPARLEKIPCRSCGEPAPPAHSGDDRCRAHRTHVTISRTPAYARPCSGIRDRDVTTPPDLEVIFADRRRAPHPISRSGATHRSTPCSGSPHTSAPGLRPVRVRAWTPVHDDEPLMSLSRPLYSAEPDAGATWPTPGEGGGSAGAASLRMSIRQPVRRAARRAFWPSLPIASDSWKSGTTTRAVLARSSITRTEMTFAGDSALPTNVAGSSA